LKPGASQLVLFFMHACILPSHTRKLCVAINVLRTELSALRVVNVRKCWFTVKWPLFS